MQSLTFITFIVFEKIPVLKFSIRPDTCPIKNMFIISLENTSYANHTVHDLFNVCSNHITLNYSGQKNTTVYPATLKQGQGHQA